MDGSVRYGRMTAAVLMMSLLAGVPTRDPGKAVWWSLLPGGGQFYTGKPLAGVVLGTGEAFFLAQTVVRARDALEALRTYRQTGDPADREIFLSRQQDALFAFFWYLTFWAYATADAYVSAHLFRVDVQMDHLRRELTVGVQTRY